MDMMSILRFLKECQLWMGTEKRGKSVKEEVWLMADTNSRIPYLGLEHSSVLYYSYMIYLLLIIKKIYHVDQVIKIDVQRIAKLFFHQIPNVTRYILSFVHRICIILFMRLNNKYLCFNSEHSRGFLAKWLKFVQKIHKRLVFKKN